MKTAEMVYQRKGAAFGVGQVTVIVLSGKQAPVTDRFGTAPSGSFNLAGGHEAVRSRLEGGVEAWTVWTGTSTVQVAFYPAPPAEATMLKLVEGLLR